MMADDIPDSTEESLIQLASAGDLDAFNRLVLKYQDLAYHHAYTLLGDHATAEDVTQESFVRAFQNISGFRCGSLRAWILKIATNTAYDVLRRSKRHPTLPLFPEDENGEDIDSSAWLADPRPSAPDVMEQKEFVQVIYRLLDELPEAYRTVLTLVDLYGLEYEEAAASLRIPIGTVKSRLGRARLQLRQKLQSKPEYAGTIRLTSTSAKRPVS